MKQLSFQNTNILARFPQTNKVASLENEEQFLVCLRNIVRSQACPQRQGTSLAQSSVTSLVCLDGVEVYIMALTRVRQPSTQIEIAQIMCFVLK